MGVWWFCGLVILGLVVGGKGYTEEDLVKALPGQPKVGFRQYAGYVDVNVKAGRSLFYYFVEAEVKPDDKTLTLWLNGGPGCSSIGGGNGRGLRRNSKSWNKALNLLFVESPAGVGWSYSDTSSDYTTAMDMHIFMMEWVKKFPAFKSRELYGTGESYAASTISLIPYRPPNAMWDDFPPSLLALASSSSDPTV
ncbi:hypothetical protein KY289_022528 [Solanum tuberosum]|nr:hypothetical protein KY289_022528 [Solanum tuberosum]